MDHEIQSLAKKLAELIEAKTGRTCAVVGMSAEEFEASMLSAIRQHAKN